MFDRVIYFYYCDGESLEGPKDWGDGKEAFQPERLGAHSIKKTEIQVETHKKITKELKLYTNLSTYHFLKTVKKKFNIFYCSIAFRGACHIFNLKQFSSSKKTF